MGTAIICIILIVIAVFSVKSYLKKLKNGCCGSGTDVEKRRKSSDEDKSHYPYVYELSIEGMSCKNCAVHVENAFHANEGFLAKVNLKKKTAQVWTKEPVGEAEFRRIIARAGYELVGVDGQMK